MHASTHVHLCNGTPVLTCCHRVLISIIIIINNNTPKQTYLVLQAALEDPCRSGAGAAVTSDDDIPEDFLDPLVLTLMRDPVILPDSHVTVDRATVERHLLSAANDPFTRSPLTLAACLPDEALRARIQAWLDGNAASGGDGSGSTSDEPPPPGVNPTGESGAEG
jgi:hypothetical protein